MITNLLQLGIVILTSMAVIVGYYNQLSDPMEEKTGEVYPFKDFFKMNWLNLVYYILSGIVLLIVLNELGLRVLNAYIQIPEVIENIGKFGTAVISGLYGHKFISKFL